MSFELIADYDKPKVKKINKHVTMAIYTNDDAKDIIVAIRNSKNEEVQTIYLFEETLKKILEKISWLSK